MKLNKRLSPIPETKILENVESFEAVVLDIVKKNGKYFIILDQTGLKPGETATIYGECKNININTVILKHNIILHIAEESPQKGDIIRIQK